MKSKLKEFTLPLGIFLFALLFGFFMLKAEYRHDYIYVLQFCGAITILGLMNLPLSSIIFKKFPDNGWVFSKIIAFYIPATVMWLLSSFKILKFNTINSFLALIPLIAINFFIYYKNKNSFSRLINTRKIKNIIYTEIVFLFALFGWLFVRSYDSAINNGTEQYMDYGFINSIYYQNYMPPNDMWFSGEPINYYYYGFYLVSYLLKVSFLKPDQSYQIALCFEGAMALVGTYSLALFLYKKKREWDVKVDFSAKKNSTKKKKYISKTKLEHLKDLMAKKWPVILAVFAGCMVSLSSNMHYTLYHNSSKYLYPDSTRFIGVDPETGDKANTEFPSYSMQAGDLHPHVVDIGSNLTILALLLAYSFRKKPKNILQTLLDPVVLLLGLLIGCNKMTNYWDFPIYMVVSFIAMLFYNIISIDFKSKKFGENLKLVWPEVINTLIAIVEIFLISTIISLPFMQHFNMIASQIRLAEKHTSLHHLFILWGLPAFALLGTMALFFYRFFTNRKSITFFKYCKRNYPAIYAMILSLCGLGLVLITEIVYVRDIYGSDYARFNTVFKLTYQSFILCSIASGYTLYYLLKSNKKFFTMYVGCLLLCYYTTIFYAPFCFFQKIEKYGHNENIGIANTYNDFNKNNLKNDLEAIKFIQKCIPKDKVILEAYDYGSSYTTYSRVSVFTGNPTVLGWANHEFLWRNVLVNDDYGDDDHFEKCPEQNEREDDINTIYTSNDTKKVKELLQKYNISYIFVGKKEFDHYSDLDLDCLCKLDEVIYDNKIEEINSQYDYDENTEEWVEKFTPDRVVIIKV